MQVFKWFAEQFNHWLPVTVILNLGLVAAIGSFGNWVLAMPPEGVLVFSASGLVITTMSSMLIRMAWTHIRNAKYRPRPPERIDRVRDKLEALANSAPESGEDQLVKARMWSKAVAVQLREMLSVDAESAFLETVSSLFVDESKKSVNVVYCVSLGRGHLEAVASRLSERDIRTRYDARDDEW